jgi:hypothetical protein
MAKQTKPSKTPYTLKRPKTRVTPKTSHTPQKPLYLPKQPFYRWGGFIYSNEKIRNLNLSIILIRINLIHIILSILSGGGNRGGIQNRPKTGTPLKRPKKRLSLKYPPFKIPVFKIPLKTPSPKIREKSPPVHTPPKPGTFLKTPYLKYL